MLRRELIRVFIESPLYFTMPLRLRLALVKEKEREYLTRARKSADPAQKSPFPVAETVVGGESEKGKLKNIGAS
jgi:hypothetical protein